jgi:hypothetical protein
MKWAYNNNGVLYDVVMTHPSILFPQGYADQFIEVPDEAVSGWLWDGENVNPPAPDTEAQWVFIRTERNKLLADCDWTQLPDAPADAAAWATYRQALRDVTTQADPFAIVWPESPSS